MFSLENLLMPANSVDQISTTTSKQKPAESMKTLDIYHHTHMQKLREEKENLAAFCKELAEKKERLAHVEREFLTPNLILNTSDISMLTGRQRLEHEIRDLEEKIRRIKHGETEADYFLRVGDILFSYTDAKDRIASGDAPASELVKKGRMPANSVYSYFSTADDDAPPPASMSPAAAPASAASPADKRRVASAIESDIGFKRDKALEYYMSALNPESLQHENAIAGSISEDYGTCPICDEEMFLNETYLDCRCCGYRDMILVDSEKPSYKDPPREMSYYAYKKINHLNEWLAQFQAKETTDISQAVLDQIRAELRKERITDMSKLKASKLSQVIKKLKLSKCYDHVPHILNRLNGVSAPVLSREIEDKLRFMFKEIQFSFVKHCPKKRSNFLSYSFVLYKFCELLELDDYLPCFPLLKSREKLYMQDKIWQKICEDMGWEFIRTV